MPTSTSGIYELVLEQTYLGQKILNVFHYLNTLDMDDLQTECGTAFDEDVLDAVADLQVDGLVYDNIRVANLTGTGADIFVTPSIPDGNIAGDDAAGFVAAPFRYNRTTKETRNGAKRFAGVTENVMVDDKFETTYFATMQVTALVLAAQMSTVGGLFDPIILRKPPTAGPTFTYNEVLSVSALNRQTTQSSRKSF